MIGEIVVIDDERTFEMEVDHYLRNSNDALAFLARYHVEYFLRYGLEMSCLYLDHDLGGDDDIRIVVDFLTVVHLHINCIYVHSQNPTTDWIVDVLHPNYHVMRIPLPPLR